LSFSPFIKGEQGGFQTTKILPIIFLLSFTVRGFVNRKDFTPSEKKNMKKLLVVLLALSLIVVFSAPAVATDIRFSGSYYATGYYDDNHTLAKDTGASSAFYAQRLRVKTVFQIAEGLSLTTRFDAMERVWGQEAVGSTPGTDEKNIQWEWAYATFMVPFGKFDVGYQRGKNGWGTQFGNEVEPYPRIKFTTKAGPVYFIAIIEKYGENDIGTTSADKDKDHYILAAVYKGENVETGLLWKYVNYSKYSDDNEARVLSALLDTKGFKQRYYVLSPYFKTNMGRAYLEGQIYYVFGKYIKFEDEAAAGVSDLDIEGLSAYLMARYDFGPVYAGGFFAYVSGDDGTTPTKYEKGVSGGKDWDPCLILFNGDLYDWMGNMGSVNYGAKNPDTFQYEGKAFQNGFMYQIFAGCKPTEKLDVKVSYTIAYADELTIDNAGAKGIMHRDDYVTYLDDNYGSELDITAAYKIYDNLEYMLGFGYLWTGDYFKGTDASARIDDNYLLMHKLTLTF